MSRDLLTRRQVIQRLGGAALGLGLAACTPPRLSEPTPQTTAAPAQPTSGGTLIYATTVPVLNTDPYPFGPSAVTIRRSLFDTLVTLDKAKRPVAEEADIAQSAGGTGPFKLESLSPGDEVRMVRHDRYWRTGRPTLAGVTLKTVSDPSTLVVFLEAGTAHVARGIPLNEVQRLQSAQDVNAAVFPGGGNYFYAVNAGAPPFNDRRVRQALSLAMDRKRFAQTLQYGLTRPAYIVWPPDSPAWDASLDAGEFNLEAARQLLNEAGYRNGFETKIQNTPAGFPGLTPFHQVFQADLAQIGIKATIEDMEPAALNAISATYPGLIASATVQANLDPAVLFTLPMYSADHNQPRFESEEYRRLVNMANQETDWDKRMTAYRAVAGFIKDEAFVLPLSNYITAFGLRRNVQGFALGPELSPVFGEVSLAPR